jgi:hypothetical protein
MRGYGAALYHASMAAHGQYIVMGDSDDSYDFTNLMPFLAKLRDGYDLVMGNRFRGGIRPGAMPWKNRYLGNPVLSGIGRLFFHCPAADFHCGMRGFSINAFKELDLRTTGMEFATEMVIKATLKGQKITEIPTTLDPDGRTRPPHLRPWRDGWRHLRFMLLYSPRWLFLLPGTLLIFFGLLLGGRLLLGPLAIDGIVLDVHTLLYCASAVWIGFQAVLFSVCTKVFATGEGLLPKDEAFDRLAGHITLERGLACGLSLICVGLGLSVHAVARWESASFGPLVPALVLREVIPAILSVSIGFQVVLSSFFLSVLGLRLRRF